MKVIVFAAACALGVTGCATVPPVEYRYHPTKAETTISLTRTVRCNIATDEVTFKDVTSVTTAYRADRGNSFSVNIKDLEGTFGGFADSSFEMIFYDDGRLKGINQTTTGQGEAAIKSAVSVLSMVLPGFGIFANADDKARASHARCLKFALRVDGTSPTIVYSMKFDPAVQAGRTFPLPVSSASKGLAETLQSPEVFVQLGPIERDARGVFFENKGYVGPIVKLPIQRTGNVAITITQEGGGKPIFEDSVVTPEIVDVRNPYYLPIPKSALFGKQSFAITFAESGAISSAAYGKTTGGAAAINSAGTLGTSTTSAAAARAAALKAESDLIVQENRLIKCQQAPATCQ